MTEMLIHWLANRWLQECVQLTIINYSRNNKITNQSNGFHYEIARLTKLKKLSVLVDDPTELKEVTLIAFWIKTTLLTSSQIVRSCRQVEILRIHVSPLSLKDLAELEPAENMTDITLCWGRRNRLPLKKVLPVLNGWRQLRRLTFKGFVKTEISVLPFEVLSDFIMAMKNLSYLHIASAYDYSNYGQLEILRNKVNELISPLRPNFKFEISQISVLIWN